MYRSKRARQACNTSWKPAEQYMHHQREQTPLNGAKKTEKARVGEQTPHNKPDQERKRNPNTIA
jgi:hypothetical protein